MDTGGKKMPLGFVKGGIRQEQETWEQTEVGGKIYEAVWSHYQQEPQPGAPDYLTLPARPRLDMLGLVPCFWLEAEKLPHLLRPFCCQHLVIGLLLNWIFRFPGSWVNLPPNTCVVLNADN